MTLTECKRPLHLKRWMRQVSFDNNGLPSQNSLIGDDCGIRVIKPRSKHNLVAVRHRLSIDLYSSNHLFCRLTKRQQYLRSSMRQTHNYYKYTHLSVCFLSDLKPRL